MNLDEEVRLALNMIDDLGFKDKLNLGLRETARVLGVTAGAIDNLRKAGKIEYLQLGTRILFPKIKIAEFQANYKNNKSELTLNKEESKEN